MRNKEEPRIRKDIPWDLFDGVAQGNPSVGEDGGILYFFESHFISFYANVGLATNKFTNLSFLNLLLSLAKIYNINNLHVYGDSQLVINWINCAFRLQKFLL